MKDKDSKLIWEAHNSNARLFGHLKDDLYSAGLVSPKGADMGKAYFPSTESQTESDLHTLEGWEDIKQTWWDSDEAEHWRQNIEVDKKSTLIKGTLVYQVSPEDIQAGRHYFGVAGDIDNFWTEYDDGDEALDLDDVYIIPKEYIELNPRSKARHTLRGLR